MAMMDSSHECDASGAIKICLLIMTMQICLFIMTIQIVMQIESSSINTSNLGLWGAMGAMICSLGLFCFFFSVMFFLLPDVLKQHHLEG